MMIVAHAAIVAPASGQDVGTQTTPEVRDFRLDTTPPQPSPQPEPNSEPKPAAPVDTAPPSAGPQTPASAARQPAPTLTRPSAATTRPRTGANTPTGAAQQPALPDAATESLTTPDSAESAATESPLPVGGTAAAPVDSAKPAGAATSLPADWMWWAAGLIALLAVLALGWKIRSRKEDEPYRETDIALENADEADLQPLVAAPEKPTNPVRLAEPAPRDQQKAAPSLSVSFTPETAQLSLANLTVNGKLSIRNLGTNPVEQLKIRTAMISAMEGQQSRIAEFHKDPARGHSENIGDAAAGEEIALALEIQIPRGELNTFDWRERQFLAPIVLANISGVSADGRSEECHLSCVVGRESQPPAPKLKPLHVDREPRRFDNLGFRPISV
ncbi:MAG: hypothetical protein IPP23_11455 [Sphingomonadales bacterium]|nr:hypothetical protein [Sphingomonadales bacterium]